MSKMRMKIDNFHLAAKAILHGDYDNFIQELSAFENNPSAYIDQCDESLQSYLEEDTSPETFLSIYAYANGDIELIDWSGEDEDNQLKNFVIASLKKHFNIQLDWQDYDKTINTLHFDELKRGEGIIKVFHIMDSFLRKHDFMLMNYDQGDDAYYPFVINKNEQIKLHNLVLAEYCRLVSFSVPS